MKFNFLPRLPTTLCFLSGRQSPGLSNERPQNTPRKGQRGITKNLKVHKEHNPKQTCLLGTLGQAAQRTQKASCSFLILYWQKVLPYCTDTGLLGNFISPSFQNNFPYLPGLLSASATSAASDHISKSWSLMQ